MIAIDRVCGLVQFRMTSVRTRGVSMVLWSGMPTGTTRSVLAWLVRVTFGTAVLLMVIASIAILVDYQRDMRIRARLTLAGGKFQAGYAGPPSLYALITPRTQLFDRVLFVDLHAQSISVEVCRDLTALRSLRGLRLNHANIEAGALRLLATLPDLQNLELVRTNLDDDALAAIGECRQLTNLDIRNNDISDAGTEHLLRLKRLRVLSLGGTSITDATVRRLQQVQSLLYVNFSSTQTTPQARTELRSALPKCRTWPDP